MAFGFGEIICPVCYNAEEEFMFIDTSYWLNRIMAKNLKRYKIYSRIMDIETTVIDTPFHQENNGQAPPCARVGV